MIIYKLLKEKETLLRYAQILDDFLSLEIVQRGFVKDKQEAIQFENVSGASWLSPPTKIKQTTRAANIFLRKLLSLLWLTSDRRVTNKSGKWFVR